MHLRSSFLQGPSHAALALALVIGAAHCEQACAQPPADQIERWIGELGDDSFTVRKAAADSLINAGPAARERLLAVAAGPDPELRAAARRIVSLIETTDFRRRLDAFAADVDGKAGVSLPGWELYRELVGGDARARALFVEMQRQESNLIATMLRDPPVERESSWDDRLMQLMQWQMNGVGQNVAPPLASCAAMLLVGSAPKLEVSDREATLLSQLVLRPPIQETMQNGTHREAIRKLVAAWIIHCPNKSDTSLQQRLALAGTNDLAEAVPMAMSIATAEKPQPRSSSMTRMTALLLIGQLGKRDLIDRLEPLLNDAAVCYSMGMLNQVGAAPGNVDLQIRDVTLIVLLRLTDQKPLDYGYTAPLTRMEQSFNPSGMAPRSAEQRVTAIAKWRKWRDEQREAKPEKDAKKDSEGAAGGKS